MSAIGWAPMRGRLPVALSMAGRASRVIGIISCARSKRKMDASDAAYSGRVVSGKRGLN